MYAESEDERPEAAGSSHQVGILRQAFCIEHEASRSSVFQPCFPQAFLGGGLLPTQTRRADQTSAPIETTGVEGHPATSVPQP